MRISLVIGIVLICVGVVIGLFVDAINKAIAEITPAEYAELQALIKREPAMKGVVRSTARYGQIRRDDFEYIKQIKPPTGPKAELLIELDKNQ